MASIQRAEAAVLAAAPQPAPGQNLLPYEPQRDAETVAVADFRDLAGRVRESLKASGAHIEEMQLAIDSKSVEFERWKTRVRPIKEELGRHGAALEQLSVKISKVVGSAGIVEAIVTVMPLMLRLYFMGEQSMRLGKVLEFSPFEVATKFYNETTKACDACLNDGTDHNLTVKRLVPIFDAAKAKITAQRKEFLSCSYEQPLVERTRRLHIDLICYIQARVEVLQEKFPKDNPLGEQHPLTLLKDSLSSYKDECERPDAYPKPPIFSPKSSPASLSYIRAHGFDAKYHAYIQSAQRVDFRSELTFKQASFMRKFFVLITHLGISGIVNEMEDVARGLQMVQDDLMTRLESIFQGDLTSRPGCSSLAEELDLYRDTLGKLTQLLKRRDEALSKYPANKEVHAGKNYADGLLAYSEQITRKLDFFHRILQSKYFDFFEALNRLVTYVRSIPKEPSKDIAATAAELTQLFTVATMNRKLKRTEKFVPGDFIPTFRNGNLSLLENCIANVGHTTLERIKPKADVLQRISMQRPLNDFEGAIELLSEAPPNLPAAPLPWEIIFALKWQVAQARFRPNKPLDPYLHLAITALRTSPLYSDSYQRSRTLDPIFAEMMDFLLSTNFNQSLTAVSEIIGTTFAAIEKASKDGSLCNRRIYYYTKARELLDQLYQDPTATPFIDILRDAGAKLDALALKYKHPPYQTRAEYDLNKARLASFIENPSAYTSLLIKLLSKALWSQQPKLENEKQSEKEEALFHLRAFYANLQPVKPPEVYKLPEPDDLKFLMGVLHIQVFLQDVRARVEKRRVTLHAYEAYQLKRTMIRYLYEKPEDEDWTEELRAIFSTRKMEYVLTVLYREAEKPQPGTANEELVKALASRGYVGKDLWLEAMKINADYIELPPALQESERGHTIRKLKTVLDKRFPNQASNENKTVRELLEDGFRNSIERCIQDLEQGR